MDSGTKRCSFPPFIQPANPLLASHSHTSTPKEFKGQSVLHDPLLPPLARLCPLSTQVSPDLSKSPRWSLCNSCHWSASNHRNPIGSLTAHGKAQHAHHNSITRMAYCEYQTEIRAAVTRISPRSGCGSVVSLSLIARPCVFPSRRPLQGDLPGRSRIHLLSLRRADLSPAAGAR